jgi:hypothetical protein
MGREEPKCRPDSLFFTDWAIDTTGSDDLAQLCLSPKKGSKGERAYRRSTGVDQRRKLMEQWAAHVIGSTAVNTATDQFFTAGCSFDPDLTAAMSAAYRAVLTEPTLMAARRVVSTRRARPAQIGESNTRTAIAVTVHGPTLPFWRARCAQ